MLSKKSTSVPIWETFRLSGDQFPNQGNINCYAKLSDEYLIIFTEKATLFDDEEDNIFGSPEPNTKFFSLFDMKKYQGSKINIQNIFRLGMSGLLTYSMFCDGTDIFVCVDGTGKIGVCKYKLSDDYRTMTGVWQISHQKPRQMAINGPVLYKKKIWIQAFTTTEEALVKDNAKNILITFDSETGKSTEQTVEVPGFSLRQNCFTVLHNNEMMFFGGLPILNCVGKRPSLKEIWTLNLDALIWRELSPKQYLSPKYYVQGCSYKDKIYIYGSQAQGFSEDMELKQNLSVYDYMNNTWKDIATDQTALPFLETSFYTMIASKEKLFLFFKNKNVWVLPLYESYSHGQDLQDNYMVSISADPSQSAKQRSLFIERPFPDIKFLVEKKEIPAHRAVLYTASKFFRNMFSSGMEESTSKVIEIPNIKASVFEALLEYIYCTTAELNEDIAWDLFIEADKYSLPGLKKICENFLIGHLTIENVLSTVKSAEKYEAFSLRAAALQFIAKNFERVFEGEGSLQLNYSTFLEIYRQKSSS